jgi:hypothetical protein
VLGPLILSVEMLIEEDFDYLDFDSDRQIIIDESGVYVATFVDEHIDRERFYDCNDSYNSIIADRLI